jgi:sugar lactone lactonase YvrE
MAGGQVVEHMGRTCLMGTAYLGDVEFENGVVEVDVVFDERRSYSGFRFRGQSAQEYEEFYVRPHRSPIYSDALQYTPVYNGVSCWQLYNGPGYTAQVQLPKNEWVHLRLEVSGHQARVFVGETEVPSLVIPYLGHGVSRGTIGVYGRTDGTSYFSNFSYTLEEDLPEKLKFDPAPARFMPPGIVTGWEISQAFQTSSIELDVYPAEQDLPDLEWEAVTPEISGMVNLTRLRARTGRQPDCVIARTTIESDRAETREYLFGYSDFISIFLNGRILFSANSAYQKRDPSFLGIVGLNDAIYLPLEEGSNELMFMVAESFGGSALICQDAKAVFMDPSVESVWETGEDFLIPESVVYDPVADAVYVSNYDAYNPSRGAGKQSISRVGPDGTVADLEWATGLNNPTGMAVQGDRLFAAERTGLAEIDTRTGEVIAHHALPEPGFPNDTAIGPDGTLYVSDSRKHLIYRGKNGEFEEWVGAPLIASPNGLHVFGDKLLVGNNGDNSVKAVDLASGEVSTFVRLGEGIIDGLCDDGRGNVLISHWEGKIYRVSPAGEVKRLLDTSVPGTSAADFGFDPGRGLLIIPTFMGNTLAAYTIGD